MSSEQVMLGLGANVGDRLETLAAAVHAIDDLDGVAVQDVSAVYETPPWPPADDPRAVTQEAYYNLVVKAVTNLEPPQLLEETQLLERAFGRDRDREVRWGPRTLDIDLLLFGDREYDSDTLTLPHPRLAERAFVLVPLLEIMPGGALPDGRRLTHLLAALAPIEGIEPVVRLEDLPGRRFERPTGPSAPPASFSRPEFGAPADDPGRQG
ncbi:2-amino-4-hydroxy-6-hydroxymethyldihydropteridine diphosphokinase [Egicoccus sp. AB-alg6-2]|uniref:2-amino-4-hydroxy-6- hydroxymethyldihydropteridine diphosphokinase n=1 Tax=Egicoccus sp. AB-alg6-2 TaxID=3242692 RepID=UPI00359EAF08